MAQRLLLALAIVTVGMGGSTSVIQPAADAAEFFDTLPPGSTLPSEAECAARVRRSPWEPRPENYLANHTAANHTPVALWRDYDPRAAAAFRDKVKGNFIGTTDELIQFYSCKWGFDEDVRRAVAHRESSWIASAAGDVEYDAAHCAPGYGVPCPTSFGLTQVRWYYYADTFPHSLTSTSFNLDLYMALQRTCFEGWTPWLYDDSAQAYGRQYGPGDEWGCIGWWYAGGSWHSPTNEGYIDKVKQGLSEKSWLTWADRSAEVAYDTRLVGGTAPAPSPSPTATRTPAPSATATKTSTIAPTKTPTTAPTKTPSASPPGTQGLVVYDNAVANGFSDWSYSYASRNACDKATFATATCSYALALNPWGALNFGKDGGFSTRGHTHLEFALHTHGQPLSNLAVLLTAHPSGQAMGTVGLTQAHVTATLANGWVRVAVPISQLNPGGGTAYSVQLQNVASKRLSTIHVDAVRFISASAMNNTTSVMPSRVE